MSQNELTAVLKKYKDLQQLANEVAAEMDTIKETIKSYMGDTEELLVQGFKIHYTKYQTSSFDTKSFKAEHSAMYQQYLRTITARRLSIN